MPRNNSENTTEPEFTDAAGAARMLSCSVWTVYAIAKQGGLAAYSFPGSRALRFKISDVRTVLQPREVVANESR
jgi:hypothetical protein